MATTASATTLTNWWETFKHPPVWLGWVQVGLCIVGNILGGSLLSKSEGFTYIPFAVAATVSYLTAFYFMALAMRTLPVSTTYPVQIAGVISGVAFVGMAIYGDEVSVVKIIAIVAMIAGAALLEYTPELKPELEREREATRARG